VLATEIVACTEREHTWSAIELPALEYLKCGLFNISWWPKCQWFRNIK